MQELSTDDRKNILHYYHLPIPKSLRLLKIQSEKIMAEKLCRCIKKVDPINEPRSIGICTKSIFNNKGFTRGQFRCKKKQTVKIGKIHKTKTRRKKTKTT